MNPNHPSKHERIEKLREHPKIQDVRWLYHTRHNGGDTYRIDFEIAPKREEIEKILEPYSLRFREKIGIKTIIIETVMTEIDVKEP